MDKEYCLHIFQLYLAGESSLCEEEELRTYLMEDINLHQWLENQILQADNILDKDISMRILKNIRTQTKNYEVASEATPQIKLRGLQFISNITAILLPIFIIFSAYLYFAEDDVVLFEMAAAKGEKASLSLPEGTVVAINSESKIKYSNHYNRKERHISLSGEAFFEVKSDSHKPFVVECGGVTVRVLGTSFGIKAYESESTIAVVLNSGVVELNTPNTTIKLKPNERAVYNKVDSTLVCESVDAEDYTRWRENRLRFENETLETIMNTISRMHNVDIVFENKLLKKQMFTGTIDNTSVISILDAIRLTSSVDYVLEDGVVFLR